MKKLVLATLAVVLFGGVALAQSAACMESAIDNTHLDEQFNIEHGQVGFTCEEETQSICDYYNHCITH